MCSSLLEQAECGIENQEARNDCAFCVLPPTQPGAGSWLPASKAREPRIFPVPAVADALSYPAWHWGRLVSASVLLLYSSARFFRQNRWHFPRCRLLSAVSGGMPPPRIDHIQFPFERHPRQYDGYSCRLHIRADAHCSIAPLPAPLRLYRRERPIAWPSSDSNCRPSKLGEEWYPNLCGITRMR